MSWAQECCSVNNVEHTQTRDEFILFLSTTGHWRFGEFIFGNSFDAIGFIVLVSLSLIACHKYTPTNVLIVDNTTSCRFCSWT